MLHLTTFGPGFKEFFDLTVGSWLTGTVLYPGGPAQRTRIVLTLCLAISREMRRFTVLSKLSKSLACESKRALMILRESER